MSSPARDARLAAQARGFTEVVERGRGYLKTRNPNTGGFSLDTSTGGAGWHYGNGLEVDSAWEIDTGAWQYRMIQAEFNLYSRNVLNAGDTIQWLDPVSGENVILQPLGLNWVDNITNSRQQIAIPQAITAQVNDDILYWQNGYGTGRHFSYQASGKMLVKRLQIDAPSNLPVETVNNPYLEIEFILKKSTGVTLFVDGVEWDNSTQIMTANSIEYRLATGKVIWSFNKPFAIDSNNNSITGIFQLRRQGANRYCTVRIPKTWIDTAVFPIIIDPTIDVDTTTDSDDGKIEVQPSNNYDWLGAWVGNVGSNSTWEGWLHFSGLSGLSGATIDVSYVLWGQCSVYGSPANRIYAVDGAAETYPTSKADYQGKTLTTAYVGWTSSDGTDQSPSLNSVFQELADSYDPSSVVLMFKDNGSPTGSDNYFVVLNEQWGGVHSLHIEYTEGGETHNLTATDITTEPVVLGTPSIGQTHVLNANGITTPAAILDAPTIGQTHNLITNDITTEPAVLGTPVVGNIYVLTANDIITEPAILDSPTIGQIHALTSNGIVTEPPVLLQATLGQTHALSANGITTEPPVLGTPSIGSGSHDLVATDITTVQAILGRPMLGPNSLILYPQSAVAASETPWLDENWVTPTNIYADDAATASVTAATYDSPDQTYVLKGYNFNLSGLPAGSAINGVIAKVNCWYANGAVSMDLAQLLDINRAKGGTNKAATPIPLTTLNTNIVTLGTLDDLWGNALTESWLRDADFGIALGFLATGANADVFVDYVTLQIFYTPPVPEELIATDILSGIPVLGAPTLGVVHSLTANGILTEPPVLDAPTLGQTHQLVSNDILSGVPVLDAPTIGQTHGLSSTDITTEPAVLDAPTLSNIHALIANDITTEPAVLDAPTIGQTHSLSSTDITTEPSVLGTPSIGQTHNLLSSGITTEPPVLDAPTIGQTYALTATDITTEPAVLGAPTLTSGFTHNLVANSITTEPAVLGIPSIGQTHDLLGGDILAGIPVLGSPTIGQTHSLIGNDTISGIPVLDSPTISQKHNLVANEILSGIPILGAPTITENLPDELIATDITSGIPILGTPSIGQTHNLSSNDILSGIPILDSPTITETHSLIASSIVSGIPILDSPLLGQTHNLLSEDILSGIPILDSPIFWSNLPIPTPEDRIYHILREDRIIDIPNEDRTIKIPEEDRKIIILK